MQNWTACSPKLARSPTVSETPRRINERRSIEDPRSVRLHGFPASCRSTRSRDSDVLDLANPNNRDAVRLRRYAPHLQILDPVSFLAEMRRNIEAPGNQ